MTDTHSRQTLGATGDRLLFAMRQAALMAFALLVAGLVTERLRPDETLDRGIVSTPFLWAIVVWLVVLVFNAVAFEQTQMRALENLPLYAAATIGALVFLIGLAGYDAGSFGHRLVYVFANSVGAVMFWWAIISLGFLVTHRLTPNPSPKPQTPNPKPQTRQR